jgi:hypothetical protein
LAHDDLAAVEVQIPHAERAALGQPQPAPVEQLGHQPVRRSGRQGGQHASDLVGGEHRGQSRRAAGPLRRDRAQVVGPELAAQHLAVEEHDGVERLILARGAEPAVEHEMVEERLDVRAPQLPRVPPSSAGLAAGEREILADPARVAGHGMPGEVPPRGRGRGRERVEQFHR